MYKTIKDRYLTFYFCLGNEAVLPSPQNEEQQERLYPVWKAAEQRIQPGQHALPQRTFLDTHEVECERWEYCDQMAYVEVHQDKLVWPIAFYVQDLPDSDIDALRALCQASFEQAADAAGITAAYSHAEFAVTYEVTERTIVTPDGAKVSKDAAVQASQVELAAARAKSARAWDAARTLAPLARHSDACLSHLPLATGHGTWHCTCGLAALVLDGSLIEQPEANEVPSPAPIAQGGIGDAHPAQ